MIIFPIQVRTVENKENIQCLLGHNSGFLVLFYLLKFEFATNSALTWLVFELPCNFLRIYIDKSQGICKN